MSQPCIVLPADVALENLARYFPDHDFTLLLAQWAGRTVDSTKLAAACMEYATAANLPAVEDSEHPGEPTPPQILVLFCLLSPEQLDELFGEAEPL